MKKRRKSGGVKGHTKKNENGKFEKKRGAGNWCALST